MIVVEVEVDVVIVVEVDVEVVIVVEVEVDDCVVVEAGLWALTAVGATRDFTKGSATMPIEILLIKSRRASFTIPAGRVTFATSKDFLSNWSSASQTTSSPLWVWYSCSNFLAISATDLRPSHCFQIKAAVGFSECRMFSAKS